MSGEEACPGMLTGVALEKLIGWTRPCYWHPTGDGLDASGLDRAAKRDAAIKMQDGKCASCGAACNLCGDHDHVSGLFRGILCRGCNSGGALRARFRRPGLVSYEADPPLAYLGWQWDFPLETGPFIWISTATPKAKAIIRHLDPENMWALARTLVAMDLPLPDVRSARERRQRQAAA
jgi:hypothetical protein